MLWLFLIELHSTFKGQIKISLSCHTNLARWYFLILKIKGQIYPKLAKSVLRKYSMPRNSRSFLTPPGSAAPCERFLPAWPLLSSVLFSKMAPSTSPPGRPAVCCCCCCPAGVSCFPAVCCCCCCPGGVSCLSPNLRRSSFCKARRSSRSWMF